jgi:hypothetical protein
LKYHLKQQKGKIFYKTGLLSKIFCVLYFLFFAWQIMLHLIEGESLRSMLVPLFILVLALVGILYRDYFVIDNKEGKVHKVFGVLPFTSDEVTLIDNIRRVEVTHFVKGSYSNDPNLKKQGRTYRAQISFGFRLKDDSLVVIEVIDEKKSGGFTESAALKVSEYLGVEHFQDRERDLDTNVRIRDLK